MKERIMFFAAAVIVVTGLVAATSERNSQAWQPMRLHRVRRSRQHRKQPMLAPVANRLLWGRRGSQSGRARRARDLVQGHGRQRPLPHLRLPAARQRADRLVPRAEREGAQATASRPGASSTIRAAACRAATDCPAKSLEETYGFDWCPGDDELLQIRRQGGLSRSGLRLSGCADRSGGSAQQGQGSAPVGVRSGVRDFDRRAGLSASFPNPRFDKARWLKVNGSLASWEGYRGALSKDPKSSDARSTASPTVRSSRRS